LVCRVIAGHHWLGWERSWSLVYVRRRRRATVSEEARLQSYCPCSPGINCHC